MASLEDQEQTQAVAAETVREALGRVLASPEFQLSARMTEMLRFLVEATLAGRGPELKEVVVGVEVFGRPADYDPKIDPVVRKEARRLRQKLQEYYLGSGAGDTVRIDLPKGGYVPVFGRSAASLHVAQTVETPASHHKGFRRVALAALAVLFVTVGVATLLTGTHAVVVVPQPLTGNGGNERSPAISRDGRQIAFAWDAEPGEDPAIFTQALHDDTPHRLTGSDRYENHPAWSPDGKQLAFVRRTDGGKYAVCVRVFESGAERILTEISAPDHLEWSPDGSAIATSDAVGSAPPAIVLISAANGGRRQLTTPLPGVGDTFPRFSPNGQRLAFLRAVVADVTEIQVFNWKSRQAPNRMTNENRKIDGFTWSPDGRWLIAAMAPGATSRSLWRVPADGGSMERLAAAGTATSTPEWPAAGGVLAFVQRRNDINLWRIRTDGQGAPAMVAASSLLDSSPAFSPDGMQVAFRSDRSGTNEIWRTGLLADRPARVTKINGALTGSPNWSPDGQWIAFDSRVGGNSDILLSPASGGEWRKVTEAPSNEVVPRWSRDGKYIYFASDRAGRWQIWKKPLAGGAEEQVTWAGGYVGAESPDSRYFYFTRGPSEEGLYRIPLGGGTEEVVLPQFAGKLWGNWAPTADGIYYLDYPAQNPSTESTIRFLDLRSKQSRAVFRLPKHPVLWDGGLALSPDGNWLVFGELDYSGSNIQLLVGYR